MGDMDPHLIHGSLGPPESSTQTAFRSVQPFCRDHSVTDRQTDRPRYSVGNNRPHLRYVHSAGDVVKQYDSRKLFAHTVALSTLMYFDYAITQNAPSGYIT